MDAWLQREKGIGLKDARRPLILEALQACQPASPALSCSRPPGARELEHAKPAQQDGGDGESGGGGEGGDEDGGGAGAGALSQEELNERLWLACEVGNKQVAMEAIAEGADVTSSDQLGWTPLHYAASCNQIALLQLLLLNPAANASAADDSGITALVVAASSGFTLAVEYLLVAGQGRGAGGDDVNVREACEGFTALHLAAANNHAETAARLYMYGADLAVTDFWGRDPETCARELGHDKTAWRLQIMRHYDEEADVALRDLQRFIICIYVCVCIHIYIIYSCM